MSPLLYGGSKQALSGCLFFEAMARCQLPETTTTSSGGTPEESHVSRRRRLSACSNDSKEDEEDAAAAEHKEHCVPTDIRRDLALETAPAMALPDHTIHESPEKFLEKLVKVMCDGLALETKKARSLEGFFTKVTDAQIEAYTTTVVTVVRNNDLAGLKVLHAQGQTLNCFNRFGESLLHMACRRGFEGIVDFLLDQPEVDLCICDDNGRTVLHDACWNPSPQLKICARILERNPELFFVSDNRGCSAFQYARPEHWDVWRKFLLDNSECLKALQCPEILQRFQDKTC